MPPLAQITNIDGQQLGTYVLCTIAVLYGVNLVATIGQKFGWIKTRDKTQTDVSVNDCVRIEIPKGIYVTSEEHATMYNQLLSRIEASERIARERDERIERESRNRDDKIDSDLNGVKIQLAQIPGQVMSAVTEGLKSMERRFEVVGDRLDQLLDRPSNQRGHPK